MTCSVLGADLACLTVEFSRVITQISAYAGLDSVDLKRTMLTVTVGCAAMLMVFNMPNNSTGDG